MQKYQYHFVRIEAAFGGRAKFDEYQEVITNRAAQGWRFVSAVVPPEVMTSSGFAYVDLVFEEERSREG